MSNEEVNLHIEQVKERFKNSHNINVNDFYEFYKDVFGDIKKSAVRWNIYKLKNLGVVRNIARGQYMLVDIDLEENIEYIVITMDIVKSSKLDYLIFNKKLEAKVKELNNIINKKYNHNRVFNISQGDELQIIYPFKDEIADLMMLTLSNLSPFVVRYGIGVGELTSKLKSNSWEMNGPIFWNARDQLEKLKSVKSYEGLIVSGYNQTDRLCNKILTLVNRTLSKITNKQWEAIKFELSNESLDDILIELGISKSSYYERLDVSNLKHIRSSFEAIYELLKLRRNIN